MADTPQQAEVIEREEQLFAPFAHTIAKNNKLIGLEAEKFGLKRDGTPLRFHDVQLILQELSEKFGWNPYRETPTSPLIALEKDGASITLEPGSQFELSGAPFASVHEVADEVDEHKRQLAACESAKGFHWLGMGYHPTAREAELDWVPKARYPIMQRYLPTAGSRGLLMMRRTATVQANFDFGSERDAMKKLQCALAMAPIVQAIFAASPFVEGQSTPYASYRAHVWLDVDNSRAGLVAPVWKADAQLGDYVQWALGARMFVVKRGEVITDATSTTFGAFLKHGFEGHRATQADWETHLNTLFPEVRIKRTLEVRSADCVPARYGNALPALYAGVLYDGEALDAVHARLVPLGHDAFAAARQQIPTRALLATVGDEPLANLADFVIEHALAGLARRAIKDHAGRDERYYVEPIVDFVRARKSIGQALMADCCNQGKVSLDALTRVMAY
jgi:glutamate--cysteine ligase